MSIRTTAAAVVVAVAIGCAGSEPTPVPTAPPPHAAKFRSVESKFAVAFPEHAKVIVLDKPSRGVVTGRQFRAEAGERRYAVAASTTDRDPPGTDAASRMLDILQNAFFPPEGGRVAKSKDFEFGGAKYPARDLTYDADGLTARALLVVAGRRQYAVLVRGEPGYAETRSAQAFIESFELTD